MNKKSRIGNKGITLIELVVVIAILSVLTGLAGPQFISYANRKRAEACAQHREAVLDVIEECIYAGQIVLDDSGTYKSPDGSGVASINSSNLESNLSELDDQYKNKLRDHMASRCPKGGLIVVTIENGIAKCSCDSHTDDNAEYGELYGDRVADLTTWVGENGDYGEADIGVDATHGEARHLTVVVDPSDAATANPAGTSDAYAGSTVKVTYKVNDIEAGYKFVGWEIVGNVEGVTDEQKKKPNAIAFKMPDNDVTVTAKFKKEKTQKTYDFGVFPYPDDPRWDDPNENSLGKQSGGLINIKVPTDRFAGRVDDGGTPIQYVAIGPGRGAKGTMPIYWGKCEGPQTYINEYDNDYIIRLTGVVYNGTDELMKNHIAEEFKDHPKDNKYRMAHGDVYKDPATGYEYVYWGHDEKTTLPASGSIPGTGQWAIIANEAYRAVMGN